MKLNKEQLQRVAEQNMMNIDFEEKQLNSVFIRDYYKTLEQLGIDKLWVNIERMMAEQIDYIINGKGKNEEQER